MSCFLKGKSELDGDVMTDKIKARQVLQIEIRLEAIGARLLHTKAPTTLNVIGGIADWLPSCYMFGFGRLFEIVFVECERRFHIDFYE